MKWQIEKKIESGSKVYASWRTRYWYGRDWQRRMTQIIGFAPKDWDKTKFRNIKITSVRNRQLDDDRFRMGCTACVDYFTRYGWIQDDNPECVHVDYIQKIQKEKVKRTIFEIE